MRTRFLRGNTAENNGLTLPKGELAVDLEKMALRLHDGSTLGGFEIIGQQAYVPNGHGSDMLVAGDATWGFYGEVTSTDFITGAALASAIGLSAGIGQNSSSDWLKFASNGKTILVPKLTFRHSLTWEDIYQVGAIYGDDTNGANPSGTTRLQDALVSIDGFDYRVRLLRGAATDPTSDVSGFDIPESYGSEWNRLFYPIHSGVHTNTNNPTPHTDPNADPYASWANYSDMDLRLNSGNGDGTYTQEYTVDSIRIFRGAGGITSFGRTSVTYGNTSHGWRPVLELVQ